MRGFDVFGQMEVNPGGVVPSNVLGDFPAPRPYTALPNANAPLNRAFCALGYCVAYGTERGRAIQLEYGTPMVIEAAAPDGTTNQGLAYFALDDGVTSGWIDRRQVRFVAATPIRGGDLVLIARATPGLPDLTDLTEIPAQADYVVILVDQTARDVVSGRIVGYSVPGTPGLQRLRTPVDLPVPVSRAIVLSILSGGR